MRPGSGKRKLDTAILGVASDMELDSLPILKAKLVEPIGFND
jgi:hypothetical protein